MFVYIKAIALTCQSINKLYNSISCVHLVGLIKYKKKFHSPTIVTG